jgi:transcriptional regulator GlxA family with amidase domain
MAVDARIRWAIDEMKQRCGEPLVLDHLARTVRLSRSRFAHLFREQTGVSPGRYLRDLRLARSRELLETTLLSVKEVMAAVGFNDPSHFSRDFSTAFGVSPREWRKRVQRPPPGPAIIGEEPEMTGNIHRQMADAVRSTTDHTGEGGCD